MSTASTPSARPSAHADSPRSATRQLLIARALRDHGLLPTWIILFSLWRGATGDHSEAMWMAREGMAVLDGQPFIHLDSWSWDPQPWNFLPTSPAWEILSALAWQAGGVWGLFALSALTVGTSLAALAWIARTLGATPTATVIALLFCATIASGIMTARAGLPAFVLLLLELTIAWRLRDRIASLSRWRAVSAALAFTFAFAYVGIWTHGSWSMFTIVAIGGCALLLRHADFGRHRLQMFLAVAIGSLLGASAGPLGVSAWSNGSRVAAECRGLIKEWTSPWQLDPFWAWIWGAFFVITLALVVGTLRRRTTDWLARPESVLLGLTAGLMVGGAIAVRFLLLAVVVSLPLIALRLSEGSVSPRTERLRARLGERAHELYWRNVVALLAVLSTPLFLIGALAAPRTEDPAVSALPRNCRLFADDWVTKSVELWRPDVLVWIDGRQDYWGRARLLATNAYLNGTTKRMLPAGTTCVLLERGSTPRLAARLQQHPDWRSVAQSQQFAVWTLRR